VYKRIKITKTIFPENSIYPKLKIKLTNCFAEDYFGCKEAETVRTETVGTGTGDHVKVKRHIKIAKTKQRQD
jgi:hypothetical protein